MTNAGTGNFDTCLEITEKALANVVSGLTMIMPNDVWLPLMVMSDTSPFFGGLRALFYSVQIVPDRPATGATWPAAVALILWFRQSAIRFPFASASPLRGRLRAAPIPLSLDPPAADASGVLKRNVVVHFEEAGAVRVSIPGNSDRMRITAMMETMGLGLTDALDSIEVAVRGALTGIGPFSPPGLGFTVTSAGRDGQFSGSITFADVALTTQPGGRGAMPVLNVLGTILSAHLPDDDPSAKTDVNTTPPNTVSFTIAPEAFRDFFFCPGALRALLPYYLKRALPGDFLQRLPQSFLSTLPQDVRDVVTRGDLVNALDAILPRALPRDLTSQLPADVVAILPRDVADLLSDTLAAQNSVLPPICGQSAGVPIPFAIVDSIRAHLGDGFIAVHGTVRVDQIGMNGTGTFSSQITLSIVNGQVVPAVSPADLDLHINFDWWVYVLGTIGGGFPAAILAGINEVVKHFATFIAKGTVEQQLEQLNQPIPLTGLQGATPVSVAIHPHGIVVQATTPTPAGLPLPTFPELRFSVSESRSDIEGPEQVAHDVGCLHRDYRYRELAVTTEVLLSATPASWPVATGLTPTITYQWEVGGQVLVADLGVVGGEHRESALRYSLSPGRASLMLVNIGRGNFFTNVECRATDSSGLTAEATALVHFTGQDRRWEDQYADDMRQCIMGALNDLRDAATGPLPHGGDPVALRDRAAVLIAGRGGLRRLNPLIIHETDVLLRAAGHRVDWLAKQAVLHRFTRRRFARATPPA